MNKFEEKNNIEKAGYIYPENEKEEVRERVLTAARELSELYEKINMEHLIVLDEATTDRLIEKAHLDLKDKLAKARGKGELTH